MLIPMTNWLIRKMVYPAPWFRVSAAPPPLEDVLISLPDGEQAHGWFYRESSATDSTPVMLFFHGNGENLETMRMSGILEDFQRLEIHFLALDYPGYGRSGGTSSEAAILEAADSAFVWLADRYFNNPKIIFGWSLGAGVAFQTAAKYSSLVDGLIALSPWTSLADVAAVHYPRWLVNLVLQEKYKSLEAAPQINCPSLVIHGEWDQIIPLTQGERVAAKMGGAARWVKVPQTGHNDLFSREVVWKEIRAFLRELSEEK
jgi:pimeloyl-ACP methyl ester carboxylesterase